MGLPGVEHLWPAWGALTISLRESLLLALKFGPSLFGLWVGMAKPSPMAGSRVAKPVLVEGGCA